jgi:DNA replication protein DnaD
MATARDVQVNPDTNEVSVQFTVHDEDLANYLAEYDDSEQADVVERALRVGMMTLQLSETTKDVEHVKREFESLQTSFEEEIEQVRDELEETFGEDGELDEALTDHLGEDGTLREHIEDAFGEDGELTERLESVLGKDGSKIQDALDPDVEGTPTYRLKQAIREIRKALEREAGREEERQQSWKKGDDFEETLGNLLDTLVYHTTHEVEHPGDQEGETPGRAVGYYAPTPG